MPIASDLRRSLNAHPCESERVRKLNKEKKLLPIPRYGIERKRTKAIEMNEIASKSQPRPSELEGRIPLHQRENAPEAVQSAISCSLPAASGMSPVRTTPSTSPGWICDGKSTRIQEAWSGNRARRLFAIEFFTGRNLFLSKYLFSMRPRRAGTASISDRVKTEEVGNASDPGLADFISSGGSFVARQSDPHARDDQIHIE
jgi:hypothetical protein